MKKAKAQRGKEKIRGRDQGSSGYRFGGLTKVKLAGGPADSPTVLAY